MKYSMITLSAAAALFGLASGGAVLASTETNSDDAVYCATDKAALPLSEITQQLETAGYNVQEIEKEDGCLEAEVLTADGKELELYLDPSNGMILKTEED